MKYYSSFHEEMKTINAFYVHNDSFCPYFYIVYRYFTIRARQVVSANLGEVMSLGITSAAFPRQHVRYELNHPDPNTFTP